MRLRDQATFYELFFPSPQQSQNIGIRIDFGIPTDFHSIKEHLWPRD